MTEQEKREEQKLKDCLQEALGYSDEDLLMEMEEAENALRDMDFAGAEDRIYKRIMEETAAESTEELAERKSAGSHPGAAGPAKMLRLRKKKIVLAVALIAVFIGMLGFSAIGGKNYFFRETVRRDGLSIFDNDKTIKELSNLERAYEEVEKELGIPVLKLSHLPKGMKFLNATIEDENAVFEFDYEQGSFYVVQRMKDTEVTIGTGSDRKDFETVYNKWLGMDITYSKNTLENGDMEYEADFAINNVFYYIFGIMEEDVFIKIIENVNLY